MSKVFTSEEFIKKLKWLVNDVPNIYASGSGVWCTYKNNKWRMDCVCSVKGLLWGFKADKNKTHGGAVYGSNGVKDFTCNGALNYCTNVSQDFSKITEGEYLCMKGLKDSEGKAINHTGIYLGNNKVFECTTGWGVNKCMISDIDSKGTRSYKGKKSLRWTYHGKLDYINYAEEPTPTPTPTPPPTPTPTPTYKHKVGEVVTINGVYVSSTSTAKLRPTITKGTITKIVNARNPYLLDDGKIGWVNDDCIVEEKPKVYKTVCNCSALNLRKTPSYGNNIYTTVKKGTKLEYLGMTNGWAKIVYKGKTLYCGASYLK